MIADVRLVWAAVRARCARPVDPQICLDCGNVQRRHTAAQRAQLAARLTPACPHCGGPVVSAAFVEQVERVFGKRRQAWDELAPGWREWPS